VKYQVAMYPPQRFGPMRFGSVTSFIIQIFQQIDPPRAAAVYERITGKTVPQVAGQAPIPSDTGPAQVDALTSEGWGTEQCSSSSSNLCVIGFFAGQDEQRLGVLREVAEAVKTAPLRFFYIDASCHTDFADSFGLDLPMLPTVVVFSARKERYRRASFTPGARLGPYDARACQICSL
jgi:hypothetical protein